MDDVDLRLDITALDLPDASFDAVICSHVLEHVDDDAAAMRELARITAPGGWCLVMVPLDLERETTYEDPTITSPEARRRASGSPTTYACIPPISATAEGREFRRRANRARTRIRDRNAAALSHRRKRRSVALPASAVSLGRLGREIGVHRGDHDRSLSDCGGDSFDGPGADVADGEQPLD